MHPTRPDRAFSLLEVIIALGLFAGAVTVIIGMLPTLGRQAAAVSDRHLVQRLPDAVKGELLRVANAGLENLASQIPVMSGPLSDGFDLVADRDGTRVQSLSYLPPGTGRLAEDQQYFLLECWRFPDEPLRFDNQKGFLAVVVRVSWPYRLPGSASTTSESSRNLIIFTISLTR
jgi:hypothetical protein